MKNFFLLLIAFLFSLSHANAENGIKFGLETGYAHAVGLEDEAEDLGQWLANELGQTVTVTTDTGAIYIRPYIESQIDNQISIEGGLLISSDIDSTFSTTGAAITISQDVFGFDVIGNYDFQNGFGMRFGAHNYEIDSAATVTLGSATGTVASSDSGLGFVLGATYDFNEGKFAFSRYMNVGGEADFNTFSFHWAF